MRTRQPDCTQKVEGERVKQEGEHSWFLGCAGNHAGVHWIHSPGGISQASPSRPQCRQEPDQPWAPPSWPPGCQRALALTSTGSIPWEGVQGLTTGSSPQPGPGVSCPMHIMRSHFSNAFVRPQWCPHPPDKAAFVSYVKIITYPKWWPGLEIALLYPQGIGKKKKSVKCLTWIDEVCWNYWRKWKLSSRHKSLGRFPFSHWFLDSVNDSSTESIRLGGS